jgi:hypothetical protein
MCCVGRKKVTGKNVTINFLQQCHRQYLGLLCWCSASFHRWAFMILLSAPNIYIWNSYVNWHDKYFYDVLRNSISHIEFFLNRPMRKENWLCRPCLLTDRDNISNIYRGHSLRTYTKVVPFKKKSSFHFVVLWQILNGME